MSFVIGDLLFLSFLNQGWLTNSYAVIRFLGSIYNILFKHLMPSALILYYFFVQKEPDQSIFPAFTKLYNSSF